MSGNLSLYLIFDYFPRLKQQEILSIILTFKILTMIWFKMFIIFSLWPKNLQKSSYKILN